MSFPAPRFSRARMAVFGVATAVIAASASVQDSGQVLRRYALIIGADDGGPDRIRLKYAVSDAKAFSRVLESLGGLDSANRVLLTEPSSGQIHQAFLRLKSQMERAGPESTRVEFIAYYSGHSDEGGLRLGRDRVGYGEFREWLDQMPSQVRIAIVDGCASGVLIRLKGGILRPPFTVDASSRMKGYAFLTSSAADEAAQESDRIGGSFFTHHLVSGMRGAADATGDRIVTLNEAYEYAFRETLRHTQKSGRGPQHPGYDIQLKGTGEIVLTDLRRISSRLRLHPDLEGRLFVRDTEGRLVAEIRKGAGKEQELGLEPGIHSLFLQKGRKVFRLEARVAEGGVLEVREDSFRRIIPDASTARGLPEAGEDGAAPYLQVPFNVGIFPAFSLNGAGASRTHNNFSANLIMNDAATLQGLQVGFFWNRLRDEGRGVQLATVANWSEGDFSGFQIAGLLSHTRGDFRGVQHSFFLNSAARSFDGIQASSSGVNYAAGDMGFVQMGLMGNIVRGRMEGFQMGAGNYAGSIQGLQIALVNSGGHIRGAQVGIINLAREVDGVQVGLINLASRVEGASLGPLGYAGNGEFHVDGWMDDAGRTGIGISHGTRGLYSLFSLTFPSTQSTSREAGAGLGWKLAWNRGFASADLGVVSAYGMDGLDFQALRMRVFGGPEYKGRYGCFAGLSLDGLDDGGDALGSSPVQESLPGPLGRFHARLFAGLRVGR